MSSILSSASYDTGQAFSLSTVQNVGHGRFKGAGHIAGRSFGAGIWIATVKRTDPDSGFVHELSSINQRTTFHVDDEMKNLVWAQSKIYIKMNHSLSSSDSPSQNWPFIIPSTKAAPMKLKPPLQGLIRHGVAMP